MNESSEQISPELRLQALEWLVMMWSGEAGEAEHKGLARWCSISALHERAWQEVQNMNARLRSLPAELSARTLREADARSSRRKALRGLAGLLVGVAAVHAVRESTPWQSMTAAHATATGERRTLVLEDGTRIAMNSATAFDVSFDASARRLRLYRGEIMVSTAAEQDIAYRPFTVHTEQGMARALGTRFTVRSDEGRTRVAVFEGAVEISPRHGPAAGSLRLDTGQESGFTAADVADVRPANRAETAWVNGMLEAEQMRLGDFLAQLSRHRPGMIRCAPEIAFLPVSGSYPLGDTQRVLDSLASALPIRISYTTSYWVSVSAR